MTQEVIETEEPLNNKLLKKIKSARKLGVSEEDIQLLKCYHQRCHVYQGRYAGLHCYRCGRMFNRTDIIVNAFCRKASDLRLSCLKCFHAMHI